MDAKQLLDKQIVIAKAKYKDEVLNALKNLIAIKDLIDKEDESVYAIPSTHSVLLNSLIRQNAELNALLQLRNLIQPPNP